MSEGVYFVAKLALYTVQNINLDKKCVHWDSLTSIRKTNFYILFENLFPQNLLSYTNHFFL